MNDRLYTAMILVVIITGFVFISGPAQGEANQNSDLQPAASEMYFEGILAIKERHGDILVRPESGADKKFRVEASTIILRNGKDATYDDLRARDKLRVYYDAKRVAIKLQAEGS